MKEESIIGADLSLAYREDLLDRTHSRIASRVEQALEKEMNLLTDQDQMDFDKKMEKSSDKDKVHVGSTHS